MIQSFQVLTKSQSAYEAALYIAQHSGLLKDLYEDKSVEGLNRYENIQELLNGIKEFSEREDLEEKGLDVFMQDIALLTNDDNDKNKDADTVSLMTIHSSKGLEFPQVYVVGLEENLFPSQMALNSRSDLEEERRLFYVAITRAESKLSLSYSTSRFKFGTLINCEPSRFLDEIDAQYLELDYTAKPANNVGSLNYDDERSSWSRTDDKFSKPKPKTTSSAPPVKTTSILAKAHVPSAGFKVSDTSNLQVGMEVEHERFGFGKVLSLEGNKPDIKATIFFKEIGQKQLLLKFAKLSIRAVRHQNGWSQEDVANKLGISIPAFSKIETGITDINLSRLQQIADIFEFSLVQLLAFEDSNDEFQSTHLQDARKRLEECEGEIVELQRKVIGLYEELRHKQAVTV
jgi:DNA helicase-2/ATP-dependent DNA helicase PcrA